MIPRQYMIRLWYIAQLLPKQQEQLCPDLSASNVIIESFTRWTIKFIFEVVSRYHDLQLQVGDKYSYLFSLRTTNFKYLCLKTHFILNDSDLIWKWKGFNPFTAKLFNLNFHPLEVVSRWRDPQPQVSENYSALTKWRSTVFKYCWSMSHFTFNMFKRWYLIC